MNDRKHPIAPTKHSMKRRAPWHDYRSPGTYMLTLAVEGRRPLLGRLILSHDMAENRKPTENGTPAAQAQPERPVPEHTMLRPHVALSPLGETIRKEVIGMINHYHPKVEVWRVCIMPDHIHLIVHVKEQLPAGRSLGRVVNGIKQGSNKAYTAMMLGGKLDLNLGHGMAENGTQEEDGMQPQNGLQTEHGTLNSDKPQTASQAQPARPVPEHTMLRLFEHGYNDRILFDGEQLERWKHYLDDNPRRLTIKRLHPGLFTVKRGMNIADRTCQIIGNHFLLDIPDKVAVIYHRRYTEAEFQQLREQWLACGERGGVLVSAAIHPNEKAVMREAMDCGYRVILLRENGFSEYYKPSGEAFDACSRGQLLQVSPWEYHTEQKTISREQCLMLNELAEAIAGARP